MNFEKQSGEYNDKLKSAKRSGSIVAGAAAIATSFGATANAEEAPGVTDTIDETSVTAEHLESGPNQEAIDVLNSFSEQISDYSKAIEAYLESSNDQDLLAKAFYAASESPVINAEIKRELDVQFAIKGNPAESSDSDYVEAYIALDDARKKFDSLQAELTEVDEENMAIQTTTTEGLSTSIEKLLPESFGLLALDMKTDIDAAVTQSAAAGTYDSLDAASVADTLVSLATKIEYGVSELDNDNPDIIKAAEDRLRRDIADYSDVFEQLKSFNDDNVTAVLESYPQLAPNNLDKLKN
jgi:hypothetical protein